MTKKVRFKDDCLQTVICEVMNRYQFSEREIKNTWYSTEDFKFMKSNCKTLSKELQKFGRSSLLNGLTHQLGDDTKLDDDSCQHMLNLWAKCGASCRGLEKWVNEKEGRKRKNLQQRSIEQVIKAQEQYAKLQPDERAEKLKSIYESCTFIAKMFARKMAIADAATASPFRNHEDTRKSPYIISSSQMTSKATSLEAQSFNALNLTRMV